MALVVLLRGINVGGHRRFRPADLARELARFDVANVGAAGTLVVRAPVSRTRLRQELTRRLPFAAAIAIIDARALVGLLDRDRFAGHRLEADMVRFVSVAAGTARKSPALPLTLPAAGPWVVKVLAREPGIVIGIYRRRMRTIGCLGELDRIFGACLTTRSWSTLEAIAKIVRPAVGGRPAK